MMIAYSLLNIKNLEQEQIMKVNLIKRIGMDLFIMFCQGVSTLNPTHSLFYSMFLYNFIIYLTLLTHCLFSFFIL